MLPSHTTFRQIDNFLRFASAVASVWMFASCLHGQTLHLTAEILPTAELVEISGQGWCEFKLTSPQTHATGAASKLRQIELNSIVRWGTWRPTTSSPSVWLDDGSWLAGDLSFQSGQFLISTANFSIDAVPLRQVRGLVLQPPRNPAAFERLRSAMQAVLGEQDTVWLADGRQVTGVLSLRADAQSAHGFQCRLSNAGTDAVLPIDKIQAIAFSPTLLPSLDSYSNNLQLGLSGGGLLQLSRLEISDVVQMTTSGGLAIQVNESAVDFTARVGFIASQPSGTRLLGKLQPASYRFAGTGTLKWPLGRNSDLYGRPIRNASSLAATGLATHSVSQVAYRLDGTDARFLAEVCLAELPPGAAAMKRNVEGEILLVREGGFESVKKFSLAAVPDSVRSAPQPASVLVDVDVTGAQLIVLVTRAGGLGQYGDHILWLDARIASIGPSQLKRTSQRRAPARP